MCEHRREGISGLGDADPALSTNNENANTILSLDMIQRFQREKLLVIDNVLDEAKLATIRRDIAHLKDSGFIRCEPNDDQSVRQDTVVWISLATGREMRLRE
jgi:hypothetical protein